MTLDELITEVGDLRARVAVEAHASSLADAEWIPWATQRTADYRHRVQVLAHVESALRQYRVAAKVA
jgi:hypothetical protein